MAAQDDARAQIHSAVSAVTPFDDTDASDEMPDAGVVTGWVMVAEWQGTDGNRWLSKLSSDASGERRLPQWVERGFCHEVADHWPDDGDG
jgi:hypothetical protein